MSSVLSRIVVQKVIISGAMQKPHMMSAFSKVAALLAWLATMHAH